MEFGKTKLELRLGFFVFVGLIILVVFVLLIGDFKTWGTGYRVNFVFNFVNGVKIGAPIRFAGVDVGQVETLEIVPNPREQKTEVKVVGLLRGNVQVPMDSVIWVNTLGLLGEKYIEIMPGRDYSRLVTENLTLKGKDPIPMEEVAELARNIANDLQDLLGKIKKGEGTLGRFLTDESIYNDLDALTQDETENRAGKPAGRNPAHADFHEHKDETGKKSDYKADKRLPFG